MARLSRPPSLLAAPPPRLGAAVETRADRDRERAAWHPYRALYKTARWAALRIATFKRDRFTCQRPECGRVEGRTAKLVCDHRKAHRGDMALFWDPENLWTLCKPCHDGWKQAIERAELFAD